MVAGVLFDTGTRVVLWNETNGLSLYHGGPWSKGRYSARNDNLKELRKKIKALYIHHSVTYTAKSTFNGLIARGLSCVFAIDDDVNEDGCATIYQFLDVKEGAWSQGGDHNRDGAGIEICYMPDAWDHPNRYSKRNIKRFGVQEHKLVPDKIHGYNFRKVFAPTDAQVKACIKLAGAYFKAFPDIKPEFPRDEDGKFISTIVSKNKRVGLLHHFNIKRGKVDAMGFPTDFVEDEVKKIINKKPKRRLTRERIVRVLKKLVGIK